MGADGGASLSQLAVRFFSFSNHKRKKKRKKNHILFKQPNSETHKAAAVVRSRGEAGSAGKCRGRRRAPPEQRRGGQSRRHVPGARSPLLPRRLPRRCNPGPRQEGARSAAHGPAGTRQEVLRSRGGRPIVRWRRWLGAHGPKGGGTRK